MNNINPYSFPFQFNNVPQNPAYQQRSEILKVKGRGGAEARLNILANNSAELCLDETAAIVWMISKDAVGNPTILPYDISLHEEKPPVDMDELDRRLSRLEAMLNDKSDTGSSGGKSRAKSKASGTTADSPVESGADE